MVFTTITVRVWLSLYSLTTRFLGDMMMNNDLNVYISAHGNCFICVKSDGHQTCYLPCIGHDGHQLCGLVAGGSTAVYHLGARRWGQYMGRHTACLTNNVYLHYTTIKLMKGINKPLGSISCTEKSRFRFIEAVHQWQ